MSEKMLITTGSQAPDVKKDACSENRCEDIQDDCGNITNIAGQCGKTDLLHFIIRVDIEHIDISEAVKQQIDSCGGGTAAQIDKSTVSKQPAAGHMVLVFCNTRSASGDPGHDQKDVPQIGVDRQCRNRIVESACIRKNGYPAKQAVIH